MVTEEQESCILGVRITPLPGLACNLAYFGDYDLFGFFLMGHVIFMISVGFGGQFVSFVYIWSIFHVKLGPYQVPILKL